MAQETINTTTIWGTAVSKLNGMFTELYASIFTAPATLDLTATSADVAALTMHINADGLDGINAAVINFDAGAATNTLVAHRVVLDGSAMSGFNSLFAYSVGTLGYSGTGVIAAMGVLPEVSPIFQLSGTLEAPTAGLVNGADTLVDMLNPAVNTAVFSSDNDTMTVGYDSIFESIEFTVTTGASSTGITPTFEYSTGVGTWASFSLSDGTVGFKNSGSYVWLAADIPAWAAGAGGKYLIRTTRTKNGLGTTPVLSFVTVGAGITAYEWNENGEVNVKAVESETLRATDTLIPASATAPGTKGDIAMDGNFHYYCYADNNWVRASLSTWA